MNAHLLRSLLQSYIEINDKRCCLLSIKPNFADKIFSGQKKFEYRKICFSNEIKKIFIYASAPTKKIVGCFETDLVLSDSPENIWDLTNMNSGLTEGQYHTYSGGLQKLYAIRINSYNQFRNSIDPYSEIPNFIPPQSFYYI